MTDERSMLVRVRTAGLRLVFRGLEHIAPRLGARGVIKVWFMVPRVPEHARRQRVVLPPGSPFEVDIDGRKIRGTSWGTGETVYLVHGWAGWGLQLAQFVPLLLAARFRVVAYDAPAHGDSDPGSLGGRTTHPLEMADALKAVIKAQGPAYGIIAHSLGAGAVWHALRDGLTADRMVFLSAAMGMRDAVGIFELAFGLGPRARAATFRLFERASGYPVAEYDLPTVLGKLQAERELPLLLAIHDTSDREVSYQDSKAIVDSWAGAQLQLTEGLGHLKILEHPVVVSRTVSFLSVPRRSGQTPWQSDRDDPSLSAG